MLAVLLRERERRVSGRDRNAHLIKAGLAMVKIREQRVFQAWKLGFYQRKMRHLIDVGHVQISASVRIEVLPDP